MLWSTICYARSCAGEEASASEEEADAVQNDATRQDAQPAVAPAAIPVQQEERILGSPAGALIDNTWAGLMRTVLLAQTGQTAPAGQAQAEPDDECGGEALACMQSAGLAPDLCCE